MKNLNNVALSSITFDDVVRLCEAETLESATLDYKKQIPNDLAKHFATFSNTFGGLIIIGVEEDEATGKPKTYEGVAYDGKLVDRIHQFATNVIPFPRYEIHVTDEKSGKVFILIKILEGDQTPYMTNSDSTVRVRTGNVSTPLKNADSRELEKLYEKRAKAVTAREAAFNKSHVIYRASFERAQREWRERKEQGESVNKFMPGEKAGMLRITVMPIAPTGPIVDYRKLKTNIDDYRARSNTFGEFPDLNNETVPGGLTFSNWRWTDSGFEYGLITEEGVIDSFYDVVHEDESGKKQIWMSHITGLLIRQLNVAKRFYEMAGFNGLLVCRISLDNALDSLINRVVPSTTSYMPSFFDHKLTKLNEYEWEIPDLDTVVLNDVQALADKFYELLNKMYWDFNMQGAARDLIDEYLSEQGWKQPEK